jgi:trehalose/maltose transport system substrate-binding protein
VNDERNYQVREMIAMATYRGTTRRELIKRASALGISAAALPFILRSQGVAAQDGTPVPPAEPGSTIVVPSWLRTDLAGAKINVMLGDDGTSKPFELAAVAKFNEATGIEATRISGATSATDRLAFYQQSWAAGASDTDVYQIDVIWPGIAAAHAVDLTEAMAANVAQGYEYFDRIVKNNTVDGALVGIPWFTDGGILYFRTDLLEKYGIEKGPETWAELEQAAKTIQDGERAAGNDAFQGFVWQGKAYEGLTCDGLEWQASQGGGVIIDPDGTVTVNNPNAIAAFKRAKGWISSVSPEGVTTYQEEEARGVWQGGNAAFMRNWPYAYSLGQAADSVIKDKIGFSVLPMGEGEGAQHTATLGGWQMFVSKYSKSQEAAIEFAKYMSSIELQKSKAIEQSNAPTIPSLYDDPDVLAANPPFGALKDVFLGGAVARPSTVTADLYNEVSTAYFTAVNQILTGQGEAEALVADLEGKLKDIVSEL